MYEANRQITKICTLKDILILNPKSYTCNCFTFFTGASKQLSVENSIDVHPNNFILN